MDSFLQDKINVLKQIQASIQNISIISFEHYSRKDLIEFKNQLRTSLECSSILVELGKIIEEKKLEEYPQLKGVHHYPIIDEIEFLSTVEKIKLDDYLSKLRPNMSYIFIGSSAWQDIFSRKILYKPTLEFLKSKGIVQEMYRINCPECHDLVEILTKEKVDEYLQYFDLVEVESSRGFNELSEEERNEISERLDKMYESINIDWQCIECEENFEVTKKMFDNIMIADVNHVYKLIKKRDESLDNV